MSPLARSLLALTAVLAVANATAIKQLNTLSKLAIPSNCASQSQLGNDQDHGILAPQVTLSIPCQQGRLDIDNYCPYRGGVCGEVIQACNTDPYGPPPVISMPFRWTPVYIMCTDPSETEVVVTITQHCCNGD